jgi:hypothetical protein
MKKNEALTFHEKRRTDEVSIKLRNAMAVIESDIDNNDGIYPYNNGRLSMAEVCRRAGIHKITLQGNVHKNTTKTSLQEWLSVLNAKSVTGSKSVRKRVTETIDDWKSRYAELARSYNEMYAIEIVSRNAKIRDATDKIFELEAEIVKLKSKLSNGTVFLISDSGGRLEK